MKNKVSAEVFYSLDIRIGKITKVEEFSEAKKNLYLITADFGNSTLLKTAAGLKGVKTPEELVGLKIVGITNLIPKQIGKHISEFLILAAKEKDWKPNLLTTEKEAQIGSEIF